MNNKGNPARENIETKENSANIGSSTGLVRILSALVTKGKECACILIIFGGCLAPGALLVLRKFLASLLPVYKDLGARLPLPMRLITDISPRTYVVIWIVIAASIFLALWAEEHVTKASGIQRHLPGLAEMLALIVILLVFAIFIFELFFYLICYAEIEDMTYLQIDTFLKWIHKHGG